MNSQHSSKTKLVISLALSASLALTLAACSGQPVPTNPAATQTTQPDSNRQSGSDTQAPTSNPTSAPNNAEQGGGINLGDFGMSTDGSLPKNFPADVPVMDAKVTSYLTDKEMGWIITFEATSQAQVDAFLAKFANWTKESDFSSGTSLMNSYSNDKWEVTIIGGNDGEVLNYVYTVGPIEK